MNILIKNAKIYDPATGKNGELGSISVIGDRIVEEIELPDHVLDAESRVVMAGAVEIHGHVGCYGLNPMRGKDFLPGLDSMAESYVRMGYTHVNEALGTLNTAMAVHCELSYLPWLDTSMLLAVPLYDLEKYIRAESVEECAEVLAALSVLTKCIGFKVFESGLFYKREVYRHKNIEPGMLYDFLGRVAAQLGTKLFVHCEADLPEEAVDQASRFHFAHLSEVIKREENARIAKELVARGASADLGFKHSGPALRLSNSCPTEKIPVLKMDLGLTQAVYFYVEKVLSDVSNSAVWEFMDTYDDKCLSFSTVYPATVPHHVYAPLWSRIASEKGLYYLAKMTRYEPCFALGIRDRGALIPGSRASLAIYDIFDENDYASFESAFSSCRFLMKDGEWIIYDGGIVGESKKKTLWKKFGEWPRDLVPEILNEYSFRPETLEVDEMIAGVLECVE